MTSLVLAHAAFGHLFAITGWAARNFLCRHWYHQLIVGSAAIFVEAWVMVQVIG
jgi:hypothetical protein